MWAVLGFVVAAAIGLPAVRAACRGGSVRRSTYPWMLYESAKLHVGIMGTLAGFAFTGIVLIVTLARERTGLVSSALDTAIVMFLVSYLFGVGNAFLISYLPHADISGELATRVHFSLASTTEYRTVFILWFAMLPLLEANGFDRLAYILRFLLPASLLLGSVIIAMAADGLGVLRLRETYVSAAISIGLALAYTAFVALAAPGTRSPDSALNLALVIFCVNALGFALAAFTPLSPRYAGIKRFYRQHGRLIVIADMHLTMASLTFLWLGVAGAI